MIDDIQIWSVSQFVCQFMHSVFYPSEVDQMSTRNSWGVVR